MKSVFKVFVCLVLVLTVVGQFKAHASESWNVPFGSPKLFVENKSQFNKIDKVSGSDVLFGTEEDGAKIAFTKTGLIYRFDKVKPGKVESGEEGREKEEHEVKILSDLLRVQWMNTNPDVEVVSENQIEGYYSYRIADENVRARAFGKLVYKNLYPGIDVEYTFASAQGIKYSLIVHPGADLSQVKMKWTGSGTLSTDGKGNLIIPAKFTNITDQAPVTFYQNESASVNTQTVIPSRFAVNGKIISFDLGSYDHSKTIVIDPNYMWNPALSGGNKAFDVETDASGNVYAYGGESSIELKKFTSTGTWLWTYTTPWSAGASTPDIWFGTLRTAPTGESYITVGSTAVIDKIDAAGNLVWQDTPGGIFGTNEYWELTFNCDYTKLWAGGTGTFGNGVIYSINLTNGKQNGSVTVNAAINEVRSLSSSPNGKLYFNGQNNIGEVSSSLVVNWSTAAGYSFSYGGPTFGQPENMRGLHAIRASSSYIYTFNGATLSRRNITTGAIINSVTVPGGNFGAGAPYNTGIDLDSCGNVYVGSGTAIYKYDGALAASSSVTTPNGTAVFDVCVTKNGYVLASGAGYVCSMNMSACGPFAPICVTTTTPLVINVTNTNPSCSGVCSGTGTANITTGTAPYTYSWNNGQSTQTATGLCAGTYSVTVNDASGIPASSTITVTAPTALSVTPSSTNVTCHGMNNGSAGTSVSGGSPGYSYNWNTGATTASISNLSGGTYTVTITDIKGCTKTATSVVSEPPVLVLNFPRVYYICGEGGGTVQLTASGGTSYSWTTGGNTIDIDTIVDPLATPFLPSTTYTVTVFNGSCFDTAQVTINIVSSPPPPIVNYSGDSMWVAQTYVHYQWYFEGSPLAGDTLYYLIADQPGHYSVYVTDSYGCKVITQSVLTSITENIHAHGIKVFPNPAKNEFTVYGLQLGSEPAEIKIYDAVGQIVYSDQFKGVIKTVTCNWSPGVYFVKVEDARQSFIEKVIIQ